jgi:hypothetical protein
MRMISVDTIDLFSPSALLFGKVILAQHSGTPIAVSTWC